MNLAQYISGVQAGGPGSGRHPSGFHLATNIMKWAKVGSAMGSNPGGTYKLPNTGQLFYVKFPQQHEDQPAAEKLADDIYNTLGHAAPDHMLVTDDGQKVGLGSPMIPGASPMPVSEIENHPQVKDGFIADAFLANWDVFGLTHDNILKGPNGEAIRIDNGGSLNFRAQGKQKDFPADKVDELDSLRKPGTHGATAYAGLNDKDLRQQTMRLVKALPDDQIKHLVAKAGFKGDKAKYYEDRLIGRRNFLAQKFNVK